MACSGCKDKKKGKTAGLLYDTPMTFEGAQAEAAYLNKYGAWSKVINSIGAWNVGKVKDFVVFYEYLEETGMTIDEVKDWLKVSDAERQGRLDAKQKQIQEYFDFANQRFSCPQCGFYISFEQVNHHPAMMVGDKYTYRLYCVNRIEGCDWDHYIKCSIPDWVHQEKKARVESLKALTRARQAEAEGESPKPIIHKDKLAAAEQRVNEIIRKRKKEQKENA